MTEREAAEDATWAGAVTYVRDMAKAIREMVQKFVADPGMAEMAKIRAEALESCADGMERAAKKARATAPRPAPTRVIGSWCHSFSPLTHFGQPTGDDACNDCGLPAARHPVATREYERGYLDACADHIARADAGKANITRGTAAEMITLPQTLPVMPVTPVIEIGDVVVCRDKAALRMESAEQARYYSTGEGARLVSAVYGRPLWARP